MRAFLVELGYFLGTLWSKTWRWALRKRLNLAVAVAVVIVVLIVTGVIVQGTSSRPEVKPTPTPTPTSTEVYTEVTAAPIDGGEGTPTPEPTAAVDEAEKIARQWASDYLERPSDEDTTWKEKVGAYTISTVLEQLDAQAFRPEGILDGKAPTEVIDVTISDPQEGAETNTPVRWSHTLLATVKGQDGSTTKITFGLVLMKGATGWMVTSVEEISLEG